MVVVEHNDKVCLDLRSVVEGLVRHAAGHGPVADDGDDMVVLPQQIAGFHVAQTRGDGGGAVARVKGIAVALLALRESAHAAVLAQPVKPGPAPGQDLVGVGLVPHIPDHLVLRKMEDPVHGDGELHHTQVGGQVAACPADLLDQELPDLPRQLLQFLLL